MNKVELNCKLSPDRLKYIPDPANSLNCSVCGAPTEFENRLCFDCICRMQNNDNSDIEANVQTSTFDNIDKRIEGIIKKISDYTEIPEDEIRTRRNKRQKLTEARQIGHYLARKFKCGSFAEIGYEIGRKDHATVIHSIKMVKRYLKTDKLFKKKYGKLINYYEKQI